MFRLLALLIDLSVPFILYFEVFRPLWKSRGLFPCTRWLFRTGWGILKLVTSRPAYIANSDARRKQAEARLEAARKDREAALLEAASEELEDEANDIRIGKTKVPIRRR